MRIYSIEIWPHGIVTAYYLYRTTVGSISSPVKMRCLNAFSIFVMPTLHSPKYMLHFALSGRNLHEIYFNVSLY